MDLETCYSERWVEYPNEKGVKFLLRYYPEQKRLSLQEKHTTIEEGGKKVIDYEAFGVDALEHMLKDWEGMFSKGKGVKCTAQNKLKLITKNPTAANWISTTSQLDVIFFDKIDGILKNFKGLLSTDDNGQKEKVATEAE